MVAFYTAPSAHLATVAPFHTSGATAPTTDDKPDNKATRGSVRCPTFAATGVCALGPRCGMLHISPDVQPPGGPRHTPHVAPGHACMAGPVGDALHRAQPRATPPPGAAPDVAIAVALPGEATPFERVRLGECLNTRGLKGKRAADAVGGALVLAHCTHYLLKRICHLGAQCRFVHAARPSDAALTAATAAAASDDSTTGSAASVSFARTATPDGTKAGGDTTPKGAAAGLSSANAKMGKPPATQPPPSVTQQHPQQQQRVIYPHPHHYQHPALPFQPVAYAGPAMFAAPPPALHYAPVVHYAAAPPPPPGPLFVGGPYPPGVCHHCAPPPPPPLPRFA